MNTFNIEKYQIVKNEDINVSNIPMLVRRKFSNLDKLVLTVLSKLYDNNIDEIIFTSKNGEFSRLKEIISQYQSDNMVSPTKFSASVHNFSVSAFSQLNKITTPYSAISAGEESLASGIISAITQPNKRICVCYADNFGIGVIISTKSNGYCFKKEKNSYDNIADFIEFLNNNKSQWNTGYGRIERV